MKRLAALLCLALACFGIGKAALRRVPQENARLSRFVPAGPLIYLEAKDFSSLLREWNFSNQKEAWMRSDNYQIFSRSRLFLRLEEASTQFAVAAGLPASMNFLSDVAGEQSAVAVYDIGKLQFLYVTYLPSARSAHRRCGKLGQSLKLETPAELISMCGETPNHSVSSHSPSPATTYCWQRARI